MVRKGFTVLFTIMALVGLFVTTGYAQAEQGIVPAPSNNNIAVNVTLSKAAFQIGEEIQITVNTQAANVSHVYVNVVDIDAFGTCTLIYPNAFSPNALVPVGNLVLSDKPNLYRFQVVPPVGTEFVQAFASLDPLDLRQVFNTNANDPFPTLCTNPQQFAQQVEAAIQGIIAVGRIASDFTSFQVVSSAPPPPPVNQAPIPQFSLTPPIAQAGQVVQFNSSAFDPDPGDFIVSTVWNFGDNQTGFGPNTFHQYFAPGTYPITLTVTDNRGATAANTQFLTVTPTGGGGGNPGSQPSGFYVTRVDNLHFKVTVQGNPNWFAPRPFRMELEADGAFTTVNQAVQGNASAQGIAPTPVNQNTLVLQGSVGTGAIEYTIGIAANTSRVKYRLLLDSNGDGTPELTKTNVFLGPQLKNPPSNPFVIQFPIGNFMPFINLQICLVLIDQPGFLFTICFSFGAL